MSRTRNFVMLGLAVVAVTSCALDPLPDESVDCTALCQRLSEKGCELTTVTGAGGATDQGQTGCLASCEEAGSQARAGNCYEPWSDYSTCLTGSAFVTCDGMRLDDIQGCDAERLAWDRCDGAECDLHGGLSGTGTTDDGQDYSVSYGWGDNQCRDEANLGVVICGDQACPKVLCCSDRVVAGACFDGACATEAEVCALLQAPPYSLCSARPPAP